MKACSQDKKQKEQLTVCLFSQVEYDATGFLEKNRDTLPPGVMNMLRRSDNSLITTIFSGTTGHSVSYNILTSYQLVISLAGNAFTQFVRLGFVKGFYLSSLMHLTRLCTVHLY